MPNNNWLHKRGQSVPLSKSITTQIYLGSTLFMIKYSESTAYIKTIEGGYIPLMWLPKVAQGSKCALFESHVTCLSDTVVSCLERVIISV